MSRDTKSLAERYIRQSPAAFASVMMHAGGERIDDETLYGGISKCDYPCCGDDGCCASGKWYLALAAGAVCCCACCCYVTDGFNGAWTYWPF